MDIEDYIDAEGEEDPEYNLAESAKKLDISCPQLKRWIYAKRIVSRKDKYKRHKIRLSEINRVRTKVRKSLRKQIIKILEAKGVAYIRLIETALETRYSHGEVVYKLRDLVKKGVVARVQIRTGTFDYYWHYLATMTDDDALKLIAEKVVVLEKYFAYTSERKYTDNDGEVYSDYSEYLVEKCLIEAGYKVLARNTYSFNGLRVKSNPGPGGSKDLDFIVMKPVSQIFIGVQVKNKLESPSKDDVTQLLELCDGLGLKPMLICRVCEPRHFPRVKAKGGRIFVFRRQYLKPGLPRNDFNEIIDLGLPIGIYQRPPDYLVRLLKKGIRSFK